MANSETTSQETSPPAGKSTGKLVVKILLALAAIAALIMLGRLGGSYIPKFNAWVEGLGFWAPVVFILGYAVATVAFIPGSLLTAASGAIFGLGQGTLYTFLGATLGASISFLVARYGARGWVEKKLDKQKGFAKIDKAISREGGKIVALLRLAPIFPFNLLNYALGLTGVRFLPYVLASVAMLPGTLLYVYLGKIAGEAVEAGGGQAERTPLEWAMLVVGLLATVAVIALVTKKARAALNAAVDEEEPNHG